MQGYFILCRGYWPRGCPPGQGRVGPHHPRPLQNPDRPENEIALLYPDVPAPIIPIRVWDGTICAAPDLIWSIAPQRIL